MTFQAIADDLGYTSKATAFNIIKKAMTKHVAEAVEDRKLLEGSRLDVLQAALWTRAVGGDLKAAQICLAIIMDRIKLFGLDREEVNADGPRTVVVEPTVEGLESFTRD